MAKRQSREIFIEKSTEVHESKYDYSLVEYINNSTKVKIIFPEHGAFEQAPSGHSSGKGCRKCANKKYPKDVEVQQRNL